MKLSMVGCSHHQAAVAVREQLAFTPAQAEETLNEWRQKNPETEAVLLSTCNRVEFYAATPHDKLPPCTHLLSRHLADSRRVPLETVRSELHTLRNEQAVTHLFRVTSSLDSMVLGEPQIVAQVKEAYDLATKVGSAGPLTHECFQTALRVAKRVASETSLNRRRVSIPSVAISDFAAEIFERFDDKQVLVIGAGEMAEETLRYLADQGAKQITVVNRDPEKAERLAEAWQGKSAPFDQLMAELQRADLVISTTGASQPIVSLDDFRGQVAPGRKQRPLFVLDLAIPRDFAPEIGKQLATYLYSIDDLEKACQRNRTAREQELPTAERIIGEERERFLSQARHRMSAPVIAQLRQYLDTHKASELARLSNKLPDLDDRARQEIERFADRLANKMLHAPMASLRDESKTGSPHGLLDALSRLFQLKE